MKRAAVALVLAALALSGSVGVAVPAPSSAAGSADDCTAAQKAKRRHALAAFERTMAARRRAFFRTHKGLRARRAFVRRQEATLHALRRAAACAVIPPPGAHVVATIPIPNDGGVGVGAGSVWVIDRSFGLLRVDPTTNHVVSRIAGVIGAAPVVGEGAVWVPSGILKNTLFRVDLANGAVAQIATGPSNDEWPITAVVTPGAVWVGNHHGGTVARVDPRTTAVVANVPWGEHANGGIYHMATDGRHVWATGSRTSEVTEIDTATNTIVRRTAVPTGTCGGIDVDSSAVWIASGYDNGYVCGLELNWSLNRVDRGTNAVRRIDVGGRPIDVRVAFGSVWVVVDIPRLVLVRIDPATLRIVGRLALARTGCSPETRDSCADAATALAVGFGALWLRTSSAGPVGDGRLFRIAPTPRAA